MVLTAFNHVGINCHDPLMIERFYTQHFGFRRARVVSLGDEQIVFLKSGGVYLELFRTTDPVAAASPSKDGPTSHGVRHLAFKVDSVDAKLAEMGDAARLTLGPLSFNDFIAGWRSAWIADPEGNVIEISQGFQDDAGR